MRQYFAIAGLLVAAAVVRADDGTWIKWTTEEPVLIQSGAFWVEFTDDMPGQRLGAAFPE